MRVDADVGLQRHATLRRTNDGAGGDADLRLDEIDAGDALGDRVLDLDARIDLDEIELTGVRVLQEFHGAGGAIAHGAADLQGRLTQVGALRVAQEGRRRALDHFLIAPLHRAVALEQMHEVAVRIAQNLHLDVTRAADELFQVHLVFAEGGFRLSTRDAHRLDELGFGVDDAHATAAATPARLQHHRETDGACHRQHLPRVGRQGRRRRHDRHTGFLRQIARLHLVAQTAHGVRFRTNENDAGACATIGKFRALGQKTVTWVDGIHTRLDGDAHDVGDVQVGIDGALALAHQITFIRLGPMQRKAVFFGINGDRTNPQLRRRTHHANGDFTAIGDQQLGDGGGFGGGAHGEMMIALPRTLRLGN